LIMVVALAGSGLIRFGFYRIGRRSDFKRRVLVLGTGSRVARFAEAASRNPMHDVVGYIGLQTSDQASSLRVISAAPGESIYSIAKKHQIDEIVVAVRNRREGGLPLQELLECKFNGVRITELPNFFEREYRQVMLESITPSWMIFGAGFNCGWLRAAVKRGFDLIASLSLLILALPVMLITAICIILEDGAPIFYRQERVGQNGRVFTIFKFRSMKKDAERDGTPRWASTNDDRITLVGHIIRKLRIDELPQIINVLRGDMSFVGPRPERPFFVDKLEKQIPYYSARHSVKPGITGWAQVRYAYGASIEDTVEKLQYDLYYVKNHGLFLDLMTLIATVEVVLWGKGAR
jgi:sugar transferase (PEP-CTERM system associated)